MVDVYSIAFKADTRDVRKAKDDVSGLGGAAGKSGRSVSNFGRQVDDSTKKVDTMGKATDLATRAVTALGAAVSVRAFQQFASTALQSAQNIERQARALGVSAEEFQRLSFAFRQFGADTNDISDALNTLADRAEDAKQGTQSFIDDFRLIGIEVDELRGKNPDELFRLFAREVSNVEDPTRRAAGVVRILGDDVGRRLLPMLQQGEEGLDRLGKQAQVASNEVIAASSRIQTDLAALGTEIQTGLQNAFLGFAAENEQEIRSLIATTLRGMSQLVEFADEAAGPLGAGILGRVLFGTRGAVIGTLLASTVQAINAIIDRANETVGQELARVEQEIARYERVLQDAGRPLPGVSEHLVELRQRREELDAQVQDSIEYQNDYNEAINEGGDLGERVAESMRKAADNFERSGEAIQTITGPESLPKVIAGVDRYSTGLQETLGITVQIPSALEDVSSATEEASEQAEEMERTFERVAGNVESAFSDAFYDIFDEGLGAFDDLADSILDIFKRTLADMAAAAIRQQIVIPITQQIVGGAAGVLGIPTGGAGGLPTGVPGVGNLAMQGLGSIGNFAISPGATGGGLGIGNIAGTIGRSILGPGAGIGASFATSSLGASLGLSAAAGGPAAASAAGAAGLTPVAGTGSALTGAGSALAGAAGVALPLIGLALLGGLFSDDPTSTETKSFFKGGEDLSFRQLVFQGDIISEEKARELDEEINSQLQKYADSLDAAVKQSFGKELSDMISEQEVRGDMIRPFVEEYFGEDGKGMEAAVSQLLINIFEDLGEKIPGAVGVAVEKIDRESENFNRQLITVTEIFANSTQPVTDELNKFVNNTDETGQKFIQSLQNYNTALQQLQTRGEVDLIDQITGGGTIVENVQQYVEVANAVDQYTFSIKSQAEQARITRERLVEFSKGLGLSEEQFLTSHDALRQYLSSLNLTNEEGRNAAASALQLRDSIELVQRAAEAAAEARTQLEKEIADERYGLETQLLELQGKTNELRERELDTLFKSNRPLQERIWKLQDEQQRAEEIAAQQERIAETRSNLQTQLLESFGRSAALVRQQLAGMTSENAALQIAISLRENVVNAQQQLNQAEQDLVNVYQREISTLESRKSVYQDNINTAEQLAETWKSVTETLRESSDELLGVGISEPTASRTSFQQTLTAALSGDREAFEALPQLASDLSQAERSQAGTLAEARRANARIASELDKAANQAEQQYLAQLSEKEIAQRQLDRLDEQILQNNRQIDKLTEQELTLEQAKANVAKAEATLKTAQNASTQAINKLQELLPNSIVNGLMEPLSPLQQIDASTKAMVDLLGALRDNTSVDGSGTGVTQTTTQAITDLYESELGRSPDMEGLSYWTGQVESGTPFSQVEEEFEKTGQVLGTIKGFYDKYFGRDVSSDDQGLLWWAQQARKGTPLSQIEQDFASHPEAQEFADGGIARGPMSGFPATLHGTEAVIPMNGERIPLEVNNKELIMELREVKQELAQLRSEQDQSQYELVKYTKRNNRQFEQWDIDGLPETRTA